jgi:rare lipoprotein A (peptidoglycan hydrolase)
MKVPTELTKVDSVGLIEIGTASYYYYHDGKKTASGFALNRTDFWIAYYPLQTNSNETHKEMIKRKNSYLGRKVKITCNGKSIICKVEDCGNFRDKQYAHLQRVGDFSPALFKYFGGTVKQGVLQNVTVQLL